jgi:hypothetical protein
MWRSTDRASFEKKPSMRLSQEPWGGMIVEDDFDSGLRRVGGVETREIGHELAGAMSFFDAGVDDACRQIDAGQKAQRSHSDVFVIAREGRVSDGRGRQVGRPVGERLDARLLVIGDDRGSPSRNFVACFNGSPSR